MFTNILLEMNASNEKSSVVYKRKRVEIVKVQKSHPSDDIFIFMILVVLVYIFIIMFINYST